MSPQRLLSPISAGIFLLVGNVRAQLPHKPAHTLSVKKLPLTLSGIASGVLERTGVLRHFTDPGTGSVPISQVGTRSDRPRVLFEQRR